MSKVMERLEKLEQFSRKTREAELALQNVNNEFDQWFKTEFGFGEHNRPQRMSDIIKVVLESSIEPSRIIAP